MICVASASVGISARNQNSPADFPAGASRDFSWPYSPAMASLQPYIGILSALDAGGAGLAPAHLEAVNAALIRVKDATWAVQRDRLPTAEKVRVLAGPERGRRCAGRAKGRMGLGGRSAARTRAGQRVATARRAAQRRS